MNKKFMKEKILNIFEELEEATTQDIVEKVEIHRSGVSRILNELYNDRILEKIKGKPIKYRLVNVKEEEINLEKKIIGYDKSLKNVIEQAKAAVLYPPKGLNSLIIGASGTGKTMFAKYMFEYGQATGKFHKNAQYISFNCADYANNPNLLLAQLFGAKRGAYTGADKDKYGLVSKADGGLLFLDEVHRLSPEGQEMLFYLMDYGSYRPLGETEKYYSVNTLIVCATTEDINTTLLNTFTRRIPIIMNVPSLTERSFDERYELIKFFLTQEACRINKKITLSANSLMSLLLFQSNGNVGKLKSEIQRGCAIALLKNTVEDKKIRISRTYFTQEVRKTHAFYKKGNIQLDKYYNKTLIVDPHKEDENDFFEEVNPTELYDNIEKKAEEIKKSNVKDDEITLFINDEINNFFNLYVDSHLNYNRNNLEGIVCDEVIEEVESFLEKCKNKFNKVYSSKIFYGLCLHVSRIIENKEVLREKNITLKTIEIMEKYREEYSESLRFIMELEKKIGIKISIDEATFISLFLVLEDDKIDNSKYPSIVVAMHGNSAATSMCDVAKKLMSNNNIFAYDLNLEKNLKTAYDEIKELIVNVDNGAGVLFLVDMGSLKKFAELIEDETGITIRTIDNVSTMTILECARKVLVQQDLESVYNSAMRSQMDYMFSSLGSLKEAYSSEKEYVIITYCMTGIGSALTIKNLIEQKLDECDIDIDLVSVIPLALGDEEELVKNVNNISKEKNVICIIGTFDVNMKGIPFISIDKLFNDRKNSLLKNFIETVIRDSIINYDGLAKGIEHIMTKDEFTIVANKVVNYIEHTMHIYMANNIYVGFILHFAGAIKRAKEKSYKELDYRNVEYIKLKYMKEIKELQKIINSILYKFDLEIVLDEICIIFEMVRELDI